MPRGYGHIVTAGGEHPLRAHPDGWVENIGYGRIVRGGGKSIGYGRFVPRGVENIRYTGDRSRAPRTPDLNAIFAAGRLGRQTGN